MDGLSSCLLLMIYTVARENDEIYVAVIFFLSQVIFVFLLFWDTVMSANVVETKEK